jgi:SM-20-related protein
MVDQIVQEIRRSGWCHTLNVLTPEELSLLTSFFTDHENEFRPAMVGPQGQKAFAPTVRGDSTFWLDPLQPEPLFQRIFHLLEDLREKLNRECFLNLKQFECHLAHYPPGTFYKKHLDRFETSSSRSFSFIFYLHEEWKPEQGGELVLYDKEGDLLQKIDPVPGSMVCFLSDEFPHEVLMSKFERRSLTGWMHTKIIY